MSFAQESNDLPDFLEKISLLQATDDQAAGNAGKNITGQGGTGDAARTGNGALAGEGRERGEGEDKAQKINLMTVHLAKGLEFENVFIAGAAEGLLPHIRSIDNDLSLEEERRLMYVAMTRAKKKLHISFYGMPSRFIAEIPDDCVALTVMAEEEAGADDGAGEKEEEEPVVFID